MDEVMAELAQMTGAINIFVHKFSAERVNKLQKAYPAWEFSYSSVWLIYLYVPYVCLSDYSGTGMPKLML